MEEKASSSSRRPVGFLDLPLELRDQIYRYCLVREHPMVASKGLNIFFKRHLHSENISLLLVSKMIGSEASRILYGDNLFQFWYFGQDQYFLHEYFTEANIRKMRKVQFFITPQRIPYYGMPNATFWSPVFAGLNRLSIVAAQPSETRMYPNATSFSLEQEVEEWIKWLRGILQCTARQLPSSCIVEVDTSDREETSTLMKECLPSGYRNVQTCTGDWWFRRNVFSESPAKGLYNIYYTDSDYDADSDADFDDSWTS
ncbi:MAG: hypothetical protein LQ351_003429 [Letrouitia transgressa]|nr:MAG: hypothetical protein LQ351_003429 [Letrouitia transgressa]